MNMDFLLFIIPAITVFMIIMAIYKSGMERHILAREYIQEIIGVPPPPTALKSVLPATVKIKAGDTVLKRRKKDKNAVQDKLEVELERANLLIRTGEFKWIRVGAALAGTLLTFLMTGQNIFLAFLGGILGYFIPSFYLKIRIWMRMNRAAAQFADVLDALVNCFKTGYGFSRAIQVITQNYDDPWGTEFGKMAMEMNLGAKQETVLYNLASRIPLPDVDMFVIALVIQKETGGNMAELLGNLSRTCRERYKLFRKVKAISAQGKLSATIVALVPFFLMMLMYVFLPGPVTDFVTNLIGMILMGLALIWMSIGIGVLFKIVQIEV